MEYIKHYEKNFSDLLNVSNIDNVKQESFNFFSKSGFPIKKKGDERWKYLDLRSLEKTFYSTDYDNNNLTINFDDIGLDKSNIISVNNGVPKYESVEGIDVIPNELYTPIVNFDEDEFLSLNTSLSSKYLLLKVNSKFNGKVLNIVYFSDSKKEILECPRIFIEVEQNVELTVNEIFISSDTITLKLPVIEMVLNEKSKVFHNLVFQSSFSENNFKFTRVDQKDNSFYKLTSFSNSSLLAANDVKVCLNGKNSECDLKGLYFTTLNSQFNTHVVVEHNVPYTKSNQYFKGILSDNSRAVFSGKIYVERDAQKSYAEQKDLNLVMSKGAEIDTKPGLEIYADDVECYHGATAGHVDESTLYYMMTRGIDKKSATQMLVNGFATEIINEITDEKLRSFAQKQSDNILPSLSFNL
ncbi:MAG: Fe-S cluster assembly protein SufD [Chloroflexota bacterium]|nr:Fe-S cluster assembly protein SufD [Chloroflexota bacterium]